MPLPPNTFLLAAAATLSLGACDTLRYGPGPLPPPSRGLVHVDRPIVVDGEVFDMEGKEFRGNDHDSQREDGSPLFILKNGAVLRNGTITHSLEGVWFRGAGCRIENVSFPDVFEDAVSTRSHRALQATGTARNRVVACYFRGFSDKAIQHNQGELEINGCTFVHGTTPIRQNGQSPFPLVTHVWKNRYFNVHSMAKADGLNPDSRVTISGNSGHHVRHPPWEISKATQLINLDHP